MRCPHLYSVILVLSFIHCICDGYYISVPESASRGDVIFNAAVGGRMKYKLNGDRSHRMIHRLIRVTEHSGVVTLKRKLHHSGVYYPNPFLVYIDCWTNRTSSVQFVTIPLWIYVTNGNRAELRKIRNQKKWMSETVSSVSVPTENKSPVMCYWRSQSIVKLTNLLPESVRKCERKFSLPSDGRFRVESIGEDLVAASDFCVNEPFWHLGIPVTFRCPEGTIILDHHTLSLVLHSKVKEEKFHEVVDRVRRELTNQSPYFESVDYVVSVPEEKDPGYVVATLAATDPENGTLKYSMIAVSDSRSQGMFNMDPNSGRVVTSKKLDREFMFSHKFRVIAVDNASPPQTGTATLEIGVIDANDHSPVFEQNTYETSVRESISVGSTIMTVRATDQDVGKNAEISYSIINNIGENSAFRIDSLSGTITTRLRLDRETSEVYTLVVQAVDGGPPVERQSASSTVVVHVLDDNDNYPQFTQVTYTVSVPEDVNWALNPVIAQIRATDADSGNNAAIRYSVIGGNNLGHFLVDSFNGEVQLVKELDYETTRSFRLVIRAQDGGSPPRSNRSDLLVNVLDVNDNSPRFYTSVFQETVEENIPIGENIVRVQAFDEDDGQNAAIKYSISSSVENMPFTIDENLGWISTVRELDREEGHHYNFQVVARDGGEPSQSATATVILWVQDQNDNDPVFGQKLYETRVSEDDSPGTPVISVTATDRDENARLQYQITNGNARGRFSITTQNGQGVIAIAKPLDYKQEKRFILTVTATDSGGRFDMATVNINVSDANTHPPVFEMTPYSATVFEDDPIGSTVLIVRATDGDVEENAEITYTLTKDSSPVFAINPKSGAITTTAELDREKTQGYLITVVAQDGGFPSLSDTTDVEIIVADVNDNYPMFSQSIYRGSVVENAIVGTSVTQLSARDEDQGLNGGVRYTFDRGDDGSGAFSIDPTSGIIRTSKVLDREETPVYTLIAYAVDRGSPQLSTSVEVLVELEDINDSPPVFDTNRIKLYIKENAPIDSKVGDIQATDPDSGVNALIQYAIIDGPDAKSFALVTRPKEQKAEIRTKIELDYESPKKMYLLVVRASSPPLRTDIPVEIHVVDVNDNAPTLSDFKIVFNNFKNYFPTGPIGRVPSHDPDVTDQLQYHITSGNNANLIYVNETTGEITLSPRLNTNVPMQAAMEVLVSDGVNKARAELQLSVLLVTEAMLFNSITVRLADMTQEAFLSPLYNSFVDGLVAITQAPRDNIYIFSVQDDTDVHAQILNVSFSVRRPDVPGEVFYTPEYLREKVYLNRATLAKVATVQVLPFDDNLCFREPCLNFEECLSILKFGNASGFISSDTILFRPIYPVSTFACRCPTGFTGMLEHYVCDTEVDLCYSNPCKHGGSCTRREGGYTCVCKPGFTGRNCEVNIHHGSCHSAVCQSGSTCAPLIKGGFICENCSHLSFTTQYCELQARSFTRGSFLTFPGLRQKHRLYLDMRFATQSQNGLLLYNGRYNEKHDFISLEIINAQVEFSFSVGAEVTRVRASLPGGVSDGKWHKVSVSYLYRTATISLDDCDVQLALLHGHILGNYYCANRSVYLLEERCNLFTETCHRNLDLTGPLQVGGLPQLPTKFQVQHRHFSGCISDLYINHELVNLDGYIEENETVSGCPEKEDFCASSPCQNGGQCEEGWSTYVCHCQVGWGSKDCSLKLQQASRLRGNGYLMYTAPDRTISMPWLNSVSFRTTQPEGLLMYIDISKHLHSTLKMISGEIIYEVGLGSITVPGARFDDGMWHNVEVKWMGNEVWINVDHGNYEVTKMIDVELKGSQLAKVLVGGMDTTEFDVGVSNFRGCIQEMRVGGMSAGVLTPAVKRNVEDGCHVANSCVTNPCPENSECLNKWENYECTCDNGFVGRDCLNVCELSPCSNNASCVLNPSTDRGYGCVCSSERYFGEYCEEMLAQPCPANWWGYPVCGPCNCDVKKGYNPHCNKTTGECYCKENYYQPLNSDTCYPCNCYHVGSFGNECDPVTGQCKCRPGVIGRSCDSCSNSFAEVTLRGCEVIYEACPKNFADKIWWEQTLFGELAEQACPSGSQGKASRLCGKETGWQFPDMFGCTSLAFVELGELLGKLESGDLELNTYLAAETAHYLHHAVNITEELYGSDILIASRLLLQLLSYEELQRGLNLTHRQDRHYIENLIATASAILVPKYLQQWTEIRKLTGEGVEHIVTMFDRYAVTLVRNQGDTFTDPFLVVFENIVFGMDTVSSRGLFGYTINTSAHSEYTREAVVLPDTSTYLEEVTGKGLSVVLPKYNNFPANPQIWDDDSHFYLPLQLLGVEPVFEGELMIDNPSELDAVVSFAFYRQLNSLLPEEYESTIRQRWGVGLSVQSSVISFAAQTTNRKPLSGKLPMAFTLKMRVSHYTDRSNPQCVTWKPTDNSHGMWSRDGCITSVPDYWIYDVNNTYINCTCDHLSTFAVLMDTVEPQMYIAPTLVEEVVTYTGIIASLFLLLTALLGLTLLRGTRSNSNAIHQNLVFCIFAAELTFLTALKLRKYLIFQEFSCKLMAILLHYTWVTVFAWLFVESVHVYRMLTEVRDINHGHMRFYYSTGYGLPAIIVGLSVGVRADQYGNVLFCWLSLYESVIWGMVGPVCLLVFFTLLTFALALKASLTLKDHIEDYGNLRVLLWLGLSLLPLLGVAWTLAILAVNENLEVLHHLFALTSLVVGAFVLLGYCVLNQRVRRGVRRTILACLGRKLPYDDSVSRTHTTATSRSALAYNHGDFGTMRRNIGISTSSTTSRSTCKTSSSQYRSDNIRNLSTSTPSNYNSSSDMMTQPIKQYTYDTSIQYREEEEEEDAAASDRKRHESDTESEASDGHSMELASSHSSDAEETANGTVCSSRSGYIDKPSRGTNTKENLEPGIPPKPTYLPNITALTSPQEKGLNINNSPVLPNIRPLYSTQWTSRLPPSYPSYEANIRSSPPLGIERLSNTTASDNEYNGDPSEQLQVRDAPQLLKSTGLTVSDTPLYSRVATQWLDSHSLTSPHSPNGSHRRLGEDDEPPDIYHRGFPSSVTSPVTNSGHSSPHSNLAGGVVNDLSSNPRNTSLSAVLSSQRMVVPPMTVNLSESDSETSQETSV